MKIVLVFLLAAASASAAGSIGSGCVLGNIFDAHKKIGGYVEYYDAKNFHDVHPQASLYSGEGGFCYGCLGLRFQKDEGAFRYALSSNVGLFDVKGYNALGNPIEFLSYLTIEYSISRHYAVGIGFGHISNAHLSSVNPGSEFVRLGLSRRL